MTQFEKVLRAMIKASGGNPDKLVLSDFMERFNHSFAFSPANFWLGVRIMKNPLDMAVLQQILYEKRPETIIECGTAYGGSAYYLASMMDLLKIKGKVITIDHEPLPPTKHVKYDTMQVDNRVVQLLSNQSDPKIAKFIIL